MSVAGKSGSNACPIVFAKLDIQNQNNTQFLLYCPVQDWDKTSLLLTGSQEDGDEINLYPTLSSHKTMGLSSTIAKVVSVPRLSRETK